MKKQNKGFTLIELLVVIAIIGILASVVLVSLGSARQKGQDAKVQEQMANMRASAEIYASNKGSYGTFGAAACSAASTGSVFGDPDSGGAALVTSTVASSPGTYCVAAGTTWAMAAKLPSDSSTWWCVDSTGKSEKVTSTFPTATFSCP